MFICLFLKLKKSLWDFCYFIFVFDSISSRRNLNEGLVHCVKERRRRKKTIKEDARFLSHGIPYFFLPLCFFNLFCFLSFFFHSPYWSSMCIIAKQLQLQQREQKRGFTRRMWRWKELIFIAIHYWKTCGLTIL